MTKYLKVSTTICAAILSITAIAKAWAFINDAKILHVVHDVYSVRMSVLIGLGLVLETGALAILVKYGQIKFLKSCCVLGATFIFYHTCMSLSGYQAPCGCIGGLLQKDYGNLEEILSKTMGYTLLFLGLLGFNPTKNTNQTNTK